MAKFQVGDKVQWTSQSGSFSKAKQGVIAAVIAPKGRPDREQFWQLYKMGCGWGRDHESYVVLVGKRPYWPRVTHLVTMAAELNQPASQAAEHIPELDVKLEQDVAK